MENPARKTDPLERQAAIIMTLADIVSWDIGPGKESDSTLKLSIGVKNWEDVRTVRALATGPIVLRIIPLQFRLPTGSAECDHPKDLQIRFSLQSQVCLNCGAVQDIPEDDRELQREAHEFEAGPVINICQRCGQGPNTDIHSERRIQDEEIPPDDR